MKFCLKVGALMESAWTLSELCRFRVMTPAQHDETSDDDGSCLNSSANQSTDKKGSLNRELIRMHLSAPYPQ